MQLVGVLLITYLRPHMVDSGGRGGSGWDRHHPEGTGSVRFPGSAPVGTLELVSEQDNPGGRATPRWPRETRARHDDSHPLVDLDDDNSIPMDLDSDTESAGPGCALGVCPHDNSMTALALRPSDSW
jgi:hypothetical protein